MSIYFDKLLLSLSWTNPTFPNKKKRHARYLASEHAATLEHLKTLEELDIYTDSIVIIDRGYYSEEMFRYCVKHNHLCLMRLKENYNLSKNFSGDIITTLPGKAADGTEDIEVRVVSVVLDDGTTEHLATNLFDSSITREMFKELYFYRWPVELKYKELNTVVSSTQNS